jgi:hypothetical protein
MVTSLMKIEKVKNENEGLQRKLTHALDHMTVSPHFSFQLFGNIKQKLVRLTQPYTTYEKRKLFVKTYVN